MRTKLWGGIGVLASIMAGVVAAGAADLAVKGPVYKAPPPAYLSDWAGLYLGVNGGYGWGEVSEFDGPGTSLKQSGGLVGGHVGYNWQFGSVVVGVEGDYDFADIKGTFTCCEGFTETVKTEGLASARVRLGYAVLPNLLAYGTAGAGWEHVSATRNDCGGCTKFGYSDSGWVAGAGLEYRFYGNWIGRAEYLHYDFGATNFGSSETVDVVRGGLSYKF